MRHFHTCRVVVRHQQLVVR